MKTWDLFLPDVLPLVPGVTEPMAEHHIRRAAQDFCQRTRAWRADLAATMTAAATLTYALALPTAAELVRLESATLNAIDMPVWRQGDQACSRFIFTPDGKTVKFHEQPAAGLPLVITATLKPGNAAEGVEDFLYDLYAEPIALGAVARLLADELKQQKYEAACNRIKTDLWRGQAAIRPRARANFF